MPRRDWKSKPCSWRRRRDSLSNARRIRPSRDVAVPLLTWMTSRKRTRGSFSSSGAPAAARLRLNFSTACERSRISFVDFLPNFDFFLFSPLPILQLAGDRRKRLSAPIPRSSRYSSLRLRETLRGRLAHVAAQERPRRRWCETRHRVGAPVID